MIERGFGKETVAILLPMFDFLTVIDKDDIMRGVEYIRECVRTGKGLKGERKHCLMSSWISISSRHG